ncbi:hypothetical protein [Exiguobacterium aurantiacum]|uniref:Uncharacterized protein n=1 Tax=Exiguobacterium aurantiacum TaxID=33987 RepID=A0A377HH89_9BACL|nr:hypothetical protein [Exiguobacterium aurantiacum]STO53299.1 Uncharacterised protein [Exiguobacterium aurantiacum]
MKEKYFIIEPLKNPVKGYYFEGETWNGWEQPSFERSVMRELIEEFKDAGYQAWEEGEGDSFVVVDDPESNLSTIFRPVLKNGGEKTINLYQSNAPWAWEKS